MRLWSALQGAERPAKFVACAADAEYATALAVARSGKQNPWQTNSNQSAARSRALMPNPSFKPSSNGVPRGPGRRYAVHFRHPGPRVTPLVPS